MSGYSNVSIAKLLPLLNLLTNHGIETSEFLSYANIDSAIVKSPDSRISSEQFFLLFKKALELTGDANLGLHLGESPSGFSNITGYVILNCSTIGEAFKKYMKYQRITEELFKLDLMIKGHKAMITVQLKNKNHELEKHLICYQISGIPKYARILTGNRADLNHKTLEVRFQHNRPRDISEYKRIFQCPVLFGNKLNAFIFDKKYLETPVLNPNKDLLEVFEKHAQDTLDRMDLQESFTRKVGREIIDMFNGDMPKIEDLAGHLSISVRSLQAKLKEEGTTFTRILEEIRKNLALSYLEDNQNTISEIAYLLGFSEPSVFNRAFKKWMNCTPGTYRTKCNHSDRVY
jgi:AraC-like DNA-binding protein